MIEKFQKIASACNAYWHAYWHTQKDEYLCPIMLPAIPKEQNSKSIYKYYWFADIMIFNPLIVNVKGGRCCVSPTFAVLPAKYEYDDYFKQCIKSAERALIRKAIKTGYTVREINYDDYIGEIREINTSKQQRGGRDMTEDYVHPKNRDSIVKPINTQIYTYGCFDEREKLVAYYMFEKITNFYHVVKGIGHSDYLRNGIMNYLFAYSVDRLSAKNECEYIIYGTISPHGEGLDRFKRHAGCQIKHLKIIGNEQQFKILNHFIDTYKLHGDSGLNYVLDYCQ